MREEIHVYPRYRLDYSNLPQLHHNQGQRLISSLQLGTQTERNISWGLTHSGYKYPPINNVNDYF